MPDGRSLCDRRAHPETNLEVLTDDEFDAYLGEQLNAPACGSCVLIADFLRFQAAVVLEQTNGRVFPPTVREGWEQLRETRWHEHCDLDRFLSQDFSNDRYDSITRKISDERIRERIDIRNQKFEAAVRRARRTARARENTKDGGGSEGSADNGAKQASVDAT